MDPLELGALDQTPRSRITHGDRVELEDQMDVVRGEIASVRVEVRTFVDERRNEAKVFYEFRLKPLEERVSLLMTIATVAVVVAIVSLVVSLVLVRLHTR